MKIKEIASRGRASSPPLDPSMHAILLLGLEYSVTMSNQAFSASMSPDEDANSEPENFAEEGSTGNTASQAESFPEDESVLTTMSTNSRTYAEEGSLPGRSAASTPTLDPPSERSAAQKLSE